MIEGRLKAFSLSLVLGMAAPAILTVEALAGEAADFMVVITGEEKGYLEPCGCAANQLGGLPRRDTMIDRLRGEAKHLLIVSNGDLEAAYGEQNQIKLDYIVRAMARLEYDLVHLGERDKAWGDGVVEGRLAKAGIGILNSWQGPDFMRREVAGMPVLIAGISEPAEAESPVGKADAMTVSEKFAQEPKTVFKIVMYHGGMKSAVQISKNIPLAHLMIAGHGNEDPAETVRVGSVMVVNYGTKGKYLQTASVTRFGSGEGGFKISERRIALDNTIPHSKRMVGLLSDYDKTVKERELVLKYANRKALPSGMRYQGSAKCEECHAEAFEVWSKGAHSRAYATLVAKEKTHDPECVLCHTVGYGRVSGFSSAGKKPDLRGVGCENCHGAGYPHRKNPEAHGMEVNMDVCLTCHVLDHSPHFDLPSYWAKIAHY